MNASTMINGGAVLTAPIQYIPNFLPDHEALFNVLWKELPWLDVAGPRLEYYVNDYAEAYTYGTGVGVRTYHPQPEHPALRDIRDRLHREINMKLGVCFLNGYRDGKDQLGYHHDTADTHKPIAIISLGAKREIYFKRQKDEIEAEILRRAEPGLSEEHLDVIRSMVQEPEKLWLESGSLCLMLPGMQETWDHRIPKASYNCGPRISITSRGRIGGEQ